jgi:hypothetical protein
MAIQTVNKTKATRDHEQEIDVDVRGCFSYSQSDLPILRLELRVVLGTVPEPLSIQGFPVYSFWLRITYPIVGLISFAISGYGAKEQGSTDSA